jgi:hypothetical protein
MWKGLYDSGWHHPGLAFVLCAVALLVVRFRVPKSPLRTLLLVFTGTTALDAFLGGALSPLPQGTNLAQNVSITAVIVGDFRLFALLEGFRRETRWLPALLRAAVLSFLVPVAQALVILSLPEVFTEQRRIYLVYELFFVMLATGLLLLRYPSRRASSPELGWYATGLLTFFLVQYGLWVVSDVLILSGVEAAWGLRLVPNALYYGLFLLFAAWRAPREATT